MKRLISFLMVFVLTFSLVGCSNKEPFTREEISATQLKKKMDDQASFIFMVERDGCAFCKKLNKYIEKTQDEHPGIKVYVLDSTDFGFEKESEDSKTLVSTTKDGNILLNISPYFIYTPAFYVVKKGKVKKVGVGYNEQNATVALWNNASTVDFETAKYEEFWDFIESDA